MKKIRRVALINTALLLSWACPMFARVEPYGDRHNTRVGHGDFHHDDHDHRGYVIDRRGGGGWGALAAGLIGAAAGYAIGNATAPRAVVAAPAVGEVVAGLPPGMCNRTRVQRRDAVQLRKHLLSTYLRRHGVDVPDRSSAVAGNMEQMELLRHTLATLAYRASKCLRDAPEGFASFEAGPRVRTPVQIVAHMGDLFEWAISLAQGKQRWQSSTPLPWSEEVDRFFRTLKAFDDFLEYDAPACPPEKLFQGPIADAIAHTGQIAMLRRLAGWPIKGENYYRANIQTGATTAAQPSPVFEFE